MSEAVRVADAVKAYGDSRGLAGLDLNVRSGEVHGLVGAEGAGKTSVFRLLLGLTRQDSGAVEVLGADPWRDRVRLHRRLAYAPHIVRLWPNLSGGEAIDLLLRLRGAVPHTGRRDELIGRFGLDPRRKARTYSAAEQQKATTIAALAADPELLLLDGAGAAMDGAARAVLRTCLRERREQGRTVLLSSSAVADLGGVCDRVSVLRAGRTVEVGAPAELRSAAPEYLLAAEGAAPGPGKDPAL
ncbi:ATP-binding cassette domain-containing protein [Nocardiopsis coralliicola]